MKPGLDLYQGRPGVGRRFLASIYKAVVSSRLFFHRKGVIRSSRAPAFVISVGNLTVGGTGKTPAVIMIAETLHKKGFKIAVLSRGYRGKSKEPVNVVSNGNELLMGPDQAGDEPFLMANRLPGVPVITGRSRKITGEYAVKQFDVDVLILDDGFQHIALQRDLNILLLDSRLPWGNNHLLPAGSLREPVSEAARADAFILTRASLPADGVIENLRNDFPERPVFTADHQPVRLRKLSGGEIKDIEYIKGKKILGFCGLARPNTFLETLAGLGAEVAAFVKWPDHYRPKSGDLKMIAGKAREFGVVDILTTAKDAVKLPEAAFDRDSDLNVWILDIEMKILERERAFTEMITPPEEALRRRK